MWQQTKGKAMVDRILFGVRISPQRKICVGLAWLVAALGIALSVMQGSEKGIPVILVGLLAVAALSRQTAAHSEKTETRSQLSTYTTERDAHALLQMVERTPHDPNHPVTVAARAA